jgi:deazaflavin-dependent oxidoreductase (nitroreductase family)
MRNLFNRISNLFMKPLLRSPLHFLASGSVVLLSFTGHKSGKLYTTPVEYRQDWNTLTILTRTERKWWRNLKGGVPVTVRLRGRDVSATADIISLDEAALRDTIQEMYPRMSASRTAELASVCVLVRIYLPHSEPLRVS